MRVQHNIPAMNAYRNYTTNTKAINKNLEKLSSGYRINRAGDDAAGLAISEKMRAQITGLATAQKNAKDGISLIQTAEGALTEVHSMLNRMFELAEQSANGTYDNEVDRANLQKEFDALRSEIDRIADSSNFNGTKLLDGSLNMKAASIKDGTITNFTTGTELLPVGDVHKTNTILSAKAKDQVETSFQVDLANVAFDAEATGNVDISLTIGGNAIEDAATGGSEIFIGKTVADTATTADDILTSATAALNNKTVYIDGSKFNVTVDDKGIATFTQDADDATTNGHFAIGAGLATDVTGTSLDKTDTTAFNQGTINNVQGKDAVAAQRANTEFTLTADMVKDGGQLKIGDTTYTFAVGTDSKFTEGKNVINLTDVADADLVKEAGRQLSQQNNSVFTIGFDGASKLSFEEKAGQTVMDLSTKEGIEAAFGTGKGTYVAASGKGLTLQIGDTAESFNQLTVDVADMHCEALGIDAGAININEQGLSQTAMDAIKTAINSVSSTRGDLGALQNRLDHTINNLSVMEENIQDAESSIRDTDVAKEMMAYTKNNILIQASQAMLAQANQLPQGVLQLMG